MARLSSDVVTRCADAVRAGRLTVTDCLAQYPEIAGQLEPLLRAALAVRLEPSVSMEPAARARIRRRLLEAMTGVGAGERTMGKWPGWRWPRVSRWSGVSSAVAVLLAAGGVAYAAQGAPAGSLLAPVRQSIEVVGGALGFPNARARTPVATAMPARTSPLPEATPVAGAGQPPAVEATTSQRPTVEPQLAVTSPTSTVQQPAPAGAQQIASPARASGRGTLPAPARPPNAAVVVPSPPGPLAGGMLAAVPARQASPTSVASATPTPLPVLSVVPVAPPSEALPPVPAAQAPTGGPTPLPAGPSVQAPASRPGASPVIVATSVAGTAPPGVPGL